MAATPGGYDVHFITEVSEDLMYILCTLTLKRPVQIADSGHRFCESCYEQLNDHSERR